MSKEKVVYNIVLAATIILTIFLGRLYYFYFLDASSEENTEDRVASLEMRVFAGAMASPFHPSSFLPSQKRRKEIIEKSLHDSFFKIQREAFLIAIIEGSTHLVAFKERIAAQKKFFILSMGLDLARKAPEEVGISREDFRSCYFFLFSHLKLEKGSWIK